MQELSEKNACGISEEVTSTEKAKLEVSVKETPTKIAPSYDLTKFQLTRILSNNTVRKSVALLGKFPDVSEKNEAIVIFEKKAFRESEVQTNNVLKKPADSPDKQQDNGANDSGYFSSDLQVHMEFINDIYGNFQCVPEAHLNKIKTTVVYPATSKHIEKYSICQKYVVNETAELYKNVTLPYLECTASQFSLEWVYNILEHKQEKERIVFEDTDAETGFVLLPDLKWDGQSVETLYLLAITHKRNLKSIRDLRATHLPLLRNMREKIAQVVEERYGLKANQLRLYFHYQPSFFHLHLHINPLRNDAPGIWCEKSHMLETVINNLELLPDYYARATLPFVLYEGSKMLTHFETVMPIRRQSLKRAANNDDNEKDEEDEETEGGEGGKSITTKKQKIDCTA